MATERFKEIQSAYAVLSDKHERSWYDQHRESILRGGRHGHLPDAHCPLRAAHCPPPTAHCSHPTAHIPQPRYGRGVGGGGGDESDEEEGGTDLWPLFSSSAFEGFGGGKGGFYAVYAEAFHTLDQEEAGVREGAGDYTTRPAAAAFGDATSEWVAVRAGKAPFGSFTLRP